MKEIIKLAKKEYNELCALVGNVTYAKALTMNELHPNNITADLMSNDGDKITYNEFFDVKYKHIRTSIFRTEDNKCEVFENFEVVFDMEASYDGEVDIVRPMERLAIIDHSTHKLYVEDVDDEVLQQYGGEEEKYIEDMYNFEGDYSWDYIVEAEYLNENGDGDKRLAQ